MSGQISIAVTTSSQITNWSPSTPHLPAGTPPTITVNGLAIQPQGDFQGPTGLQLVIFDTTQTIPTPASILSNAWLPVRTNDPNSNSWSGSYDYIWEWLVQTLLVSGNPANQLVILASYGLDASMGPDTGALEQLLSYGAGQQLQTWEKTADIGSQVGNSTSWVSFPANYIFVGFGGSGYGGGSELYQTPQGSSTSVTSTLNVNVQPEARQLKAA